MPLPDLQEDMRGGQDGDLVIRGRGLARGQQDLEGERGEEKGDERIPHPVRKAGDRPQRWCGDKLAVIRLELSIDGAVGLRLIGQ